MSPPTLLLLRSSFACLLAGLASAVTLAWNRGLAVQLRPLHAELLLWGFATLLVFGVGLHVFPRFAGQAIRPSGLVPAFANVALLAVVVSAAGWLLGLAGVAGAEALLLVGAVLHVLTAVAFTGLVLPLLLRSAHVRG